MAAPSPLVIAQEKMEAIAAVRTTVTPSKADLQAGGALGSEAAPPGQPPESSKVEENKTGEEPVKWAMAPFKDDGEEERRVRGNLLCKLLARRPALVRKFNELPEIQQLLVLTLQEAESGKGERLKEKLLEASESERYEVSQIIYSQEGV